MNIRKSEINDIDSIMEVIYDAQAYLKSQNIDQWQDGYPNHESFKDDINKNFSYVLTDNENIVGTMYFSFEEDPCYKGIDGQWKTNGCYAVIHRIAVLSSYKGKGTAKVLLDFAVNECKKNNIPSIRIDTHIENLSMQRFLYKNGFELCGTITLMSGASRIALEKIIE
jgi:GNAT superfamily N-acetyltransferase